MPPERLIETKAQKACRHCRLHKRRCDKRLPRCSRCSICEYDDDAPIEATEPDTKRLWSEPLAIKRDSCGLELTPAGEKQLLWIACQNQEQHSDQAGTKSLISLVKDTLKHGGTSVEQVLTRYFATAHNWMPIVDEPKFRFNLQIIRENTELYYDPLALLLLCMLLMKQQPCYHPNHTSNSALYRTTRRIFALLNTSLIDAYSLTRLHAGLLLSAYECGHGMAREASSTLASCFGLIRQLDMSAVQNKAADRHYADVQESARRLCWASIVFLDRSIVLSCADNSAALLIPTSGILPQDAVPYMNKNDYALMNAGTKFQTRAHSALLIGEAIKAVHGDPESTECIEAEKLLHYLVRQHAATSEGESYPVCEGVTMALSAVVSAYKNRAKRPRSAAAAPDAKLGLDLTFAYNIVFEMCRAEGLIMGKRDTSLHRMCFSGLGCLYRAAVDLVEVYPKGASAEDVKQLRENLEWFSGHWEVADVLLERLNRIVEFRSKQVFPGFGRQF
ncbi:hypothetical protein THARTR1_07063 [Trichoderma harzianum]|uniref:Zn(2)-C6 fungal-type domain-containing protein n=1 Tax=Trichoderma harzianum TaxID=5544 RepID=A0A2K0U3V3_TRIHA|nr:hypothetical protein THARTR1_07063 [Trichoderma harzianum]